MTTNDASTPGLDPQDYTWDSFQFNWNGDVSWRNRIRDWYNKIRYPLLTVRYRWLIPQTNRLYKPDLVLGGGIGMPSSILRRIAHLLGGQPIRRLLIVGCGRAWDFGQWLSLKPAEVIGVDLYSFRRAWTEVQKVSRQHDIEARFLQADLKDLSVIPDDWADVIISAAVFEHVVDLETALLQIRRKVRKEGLIYAGYGPIWHCAEGDHYSSRGGLSRAYNHLLLDPPAYAAFFQQYLQTEEDPQGGARYVMLDLFSKLSSDQYLALYARLGLERRFLAIELSPLALTFKGRFESHWQTLLTRYPALREEEFLIKGHYIILQS